MLEFVRLLENRNKILPAKNSANNNRSLENYCWVSKKNSILSVFLEQTCAAHKLVVENKGFIEVLLMFYNIIIQKGIVLNNWRCVFNAMLDKGKGPVLGKLQIIELIKGDL